jgi:hypothetical protein
MKVTLKTDPFGWAYLLVAEDGRNRLIQTDWDYPGVACNLGWSPCCDATDGTVDCKAHGKNASELIASAQKFLDDHIGEFFDDPGYFNGEE